MNFPTTDLETLRAGLAQGETTARAAVEASLNAAERLNETLNAFLQIDRAGALRRAEEIDAAAGDSGESNGALAVVSPCANPARSVSRSVVGKFIFDSAC